MLVARAASRASPVISNTVAQLTTNHRKEVNAYEFGMLSVVALNTSLSRSVIQAAAVYGKAHSIEFK